MRAVLYDGAGGSEVITVRDVPVPKPARDEVLVRVAASGINRADAAQRRGVYPPPPGASDIPGLEVAGTIVAHGEAVDPDVWPLHAPVCALLAGGGYAEYVAVPVGQLLKLPEGMSPRDAAAIVEVAATVVSNMSMTVQVAEGDWVLVHGASGGIGTFAVQYLAALGARVITTGSSAEKLQWARDLGAHHTINYRTENFADRVHDITGGHGADYILDVVGADYLADNLAALAVGGRLVVIGLGSGSQAPLDLGLLLRKRAGVIATSLRPRPTEEKARIIAEVQQRVWPLLTSGALSVPVDRAFSLEQTREAHDYFDSGEHRGKVVLLVGESDDDE
ncbi:NAD(P)H-quinone oxidoreductase [Microbacterium sp. YY-01]|uniref:NAD(P)H-quinone oxidoreductase n=1 Tax=Microbacterium sp. YY-01 TaxID=3421634 RepID=UPI003D172E44